MGDVARHLDAAGIERLRNGLRIMALRALNDPDAAEEVAQESLARGLEAMEAGQFRDEGSVGAYFRGICRHVIVDRIRRESRLTSLNTLPDQPDQAALPDALHALISRERKEQVLRALSELPPQSLECLRLSFYEGLKPSEIARRLGEPGPRVRKRHQRALDKLREVFFAQTHAASHDVGATPTYSQRNTPPLSAREQEDLA